MTFLWVHLIVKPRNNQPSITGFLFLFQEIGQQIFQLIIVKIVQ